MMLPWNVNQLGPEREKEREKEEEGRGGGSKREALNNIRAITIPKSSQFTQRLHIRAEAFIQTASGSIQRIN